MGLERKLVLINCGVCEYALQKLAFSCVPFDQRWSQCVCLTTRLFVCAQKHKLAQTKKLNKTTCDMQRCGALHSLRPYKYESVEMCRGYYTHTHTLRT